MFHLDPDDTSYGLSPLTVAPFAGSRWRGLFTDDVLQAHLDHSERDQRPTAGGRSGGNRPVTRPRSSGEASSRSSICARWCPTVVSTRISEKAADASGANCLDIEAHGRENPDHGLWRADGVQHTRHPFR
jgi:hypothetical protein